VLRNLVDRYARERGDKTFIVMSTGEEWTYARLRTNVRKVAASLQALGVKQDDFVLSWLPNGPHAIAVWFALNYIGAVYVPVNVSYRGRLLAHVIKNSGARLMIADARLAQRLGEVDTAALDTLVAISGSPPQGLKGHSRPCRRGAFIRNKRACRSAASHHALGHARGHLYIWYNGPLKGRAVVLSPYRGDRRSDRYRDLGRSRARQPATVPRRRHRRRVSYC